MLRRLLHPLQTRRCFLRLPRRRPHERRGHTTRMLHGTEPERRNRRPGPCRTCPFHTHRIGWLRASANCGRCYVPVNWLPWPLSLTRAEMLCNGSRYRSPDEANGRDGGTVTSQPDYLRVAEIDTCIE